MLIERNKFDHDPPWRYAVTCDFANGQYGSFKCWLIMGKYKTLSAAFDALEHYKSYKPSRIEHIYYEPITKQP